MWCYPVPSPERILQEEGGEEKNMTVWIALGVVVLAWLSYLSIYSLFFSKEGRKRGARKRL